MMGSSPSTGGVVLIGWDAFAEQVLHQLIAAGLSAQVILRDPNAKAHLEAKHETRCSATLVPDIRAFELMDHALKAARVVLINLEDDREKLIYAVNLRKRYPNIKIVAPVSNPNLAETFVSAAEVLPLSKEEVSGKIFASYLFERDVAEFLNDLLSPAQTDEDHDIQEVYLSEGHPYVGERYGDLFLELYEAHNAVLIGLSRRSDGTYLLHKNPPDETIIASEDVLIVVVNGAAANALRGDAKPRGER